MINQARNMEGANKDYIENHIPHIAQCLARDPDEMILSCEAFVLGNGTKGFADILEKTSEQTPIIDLVRLDAPYEKRKAYAGICW